LAAIVKLAVPIATSPALDTPAVLARATKVTAPEHGPPVQLSLSSAERRLTRASGFTTTSPPVEVTAVLVVVCVAGTELARVLVVTVELVSGAGVLVAVLDVTVVVVEAVSVTVCVSVVVVVTVALWASVSVSVLVVVTVVLAVSVAVAVLVVVTVVL